MIQCIEKDFFVDGVFIVPNPKKNSCRYSLCSGVKGLVIDDDFLEEDTEYLEVNVLG